MQPEITTLPTIQFVGGSTETIKFNLNTLSGTPFDATGATINFAVTRYGNKNGTPNITKTATLETDANGVYSVAVVNLTASDTLSLYDKFIYQITIQDVNEKVEIPFYGDMYIINNINKSFLA